MWDEEDEWDEYDDEGWDDDEDGYGDWDDDEEGCKFEDELDEYGWDDKFNDEFGDRLKNREEGIEDDYGNLYTSNKYESQNKKMREGVGKNAGEAFKQAGKTVKETAGKASIAGMFVDRAKKYAKNHKKIKRMKQEAKSIGCQSFQIQECPRCKELSLFKEPFLKGIFLSAIGSMWGRKAHWFCFNPQCKSYYMRTGDYFVDLGGFVSPMPKKNLFFIPKK